MLLMLVPISEISVQMVNYIVSLLMPTTLRPQLSFEKGIPAAYKTVVVIPTMLLSKDSIQKEIDRLEIRYLANTDPQLRFGLFGDFADAKTQTTESDKALLDAACNGLKALEDKYGKGKFFLFHRMRVWSEGEQAWMGWERKRGKLDCLNRFLLGEPLAENILYMGNPEELKDIRYVITLDTDTQLPKDQAKALIEVLAHPLNHPYLNEEKNGLERGYTIIQPRVTTDFIHSKASRFAKIFSDPAFVDPYTLAIFNVYQDLFQEGSYHGKGIYHLEAFQTILSDRFSEDHILSHDLIEGAYVRTAFASNICLYDIHPKDCLTSTRRQHRWMRGDWQIVDWLKSYVPSAKQLKAVNPLSAINRWKIFDNVRRATLPVALVALLITSWATSLIPVWCTGLTVLVLLLPCIHLCLCKVFTYSFSLVKSSLIDIQLVVLRTLITISLLPYEAYNSIDAFFRVAYRRLISKKNLLQWTACVDGCQGRTKAHAKFLWGLGAVSLFAAATVATAAFVNPKELYLVVPICFLWMLSPLIAYVIDKPLEYSTRDSLSNDDQQFLRMVARKTWRYFDELVGPRTHWMPPDNYQTELNVEVAQRTSPTNTGLWLLTVLSAYDLRYITPDILIDRCLATFQECSKLERYEGHFLNWYNIQTLNPLYPRYVSTVDSGNFLASIWTVKQGLLDMASSQSLPLDIFSGINDTFELYLQESRSHRGAILPSMLDSDPSSVLDTITALQKCRESLQAHRRASEQNGGYWLDQVEQQLNGWDSVIDRYFEWVKILALLSNEQLLELDVEAIQWKEQGLHWRPSLEELANSKYLPAIESLLLTAQKPDMPKELTGWAKKLKEALSVASWLAGEKLGQMSAVINDIDRITQEMNLEFLYNDQRKLFAIGYNVDDKRLDTSYYDLLASEARIASLVAIAKEDIPLDHWWALGRFYSVVGGEKVLLSWGGTMFEYLMPLIFNKYYTDSLMGEACDAAVTCQIAYGEKRGIPWGISESAFSAIDSHKTYQYKSFGVPGLGLKRGLENDLVISPYSSALALSVDPKSAVDNLRRMSHQMIGDYGYYEAIDFTRQTSPTGERGIVVYAYMAHHQGMILTSINNALNNDLFVERFQKDPRISGLSSLLYERIPSSTPVKVQSMRDEPVHRRLEPFSQSPVMGVMDTPESVTPKIMLLSNESYSLMITNSGGGYGRWDDIDLYRWRSDTTCDSWGSFCYIKDLRSSDVWSATFQPTQTKGSSYSVNFKADKAEFKRRDQQIETITEIIVTPEDNAEVRMITLINHSNVEHVLELTSYLELVMAPHLADRAHPCFNKMFIETEALPELSALMASRRMRSSDDRPLYAMHVVSSSVAGVGEIQYETDRGAFIGRGNTLKHPAALDGPLSNSQGAVLDPIFSLRRRVIIEPGKRVIFSFVTAIADTRSSALALIEKYKNLAASHRAMELAWTYAQLELRYLRIQQEEMQLFQKLASRIIYPQNQLRAVEERIRRNKLGQSSLWQYGISGDLPIVVVTVGDIYDVGVVKQLLQAHTFLSLRGLKFDLVVLDEEEQGYFQPLRDHLQSLINAYSYRNEQDSPGGIFLRSSGLLAPDDLNLLLTVSRAILVASRGSLRQQLVSPKPRWALPKKLVANQAIGEAPSGPLPFMELPYFNGLGGFTHDGRLYVIYLGPNSNTPAPWINVLANPQFGTIVTEAGPGCTWFGNSQTNRLTPWSNDPAVNKISDAIYLRDEERGTVWTATPSPIREHDAYRISHGQGFSRFEHNSHGIEQELLIFVPVDDNGGLPLRIQRLRLKNSSSRHRKLSATAYSELVLGTDKEETEMYIVSEWDAEHETLYGYNRYNPDFGKYAAFCYSNLPIASYTGDRTEFLGRNSSVATPAALTRKSLSGHTGAALDPCLSLQVELSLAPGQTVDVIFILGYAEDSVQAQELIMKARAPESVEELFTKTKNWWDKTLETIQVEVPDKATEFFMNRWLVYQDISCRFWGRSAFYQSSGALGYRDQLQDTMAIVYSQPGLAREYILKAASRQYVEGDVQHWWHPQTGAGVRTRCSDDLLWLPFVTAHYIRVTQDRTILDEIVPFLEGEPLKEEQQELFQIPTISKEEASLLEHCRRAIKKGITAGPQGLPLIGSGDWNDGMNHVGIHGKGESVWLAWFIVHVLHDFADLISEEAGGGLRAQAKRLGELADTVAWDGNWWRRAYYDDGTPIGSKENPEASIDSLTQSWAVISGLADKERCQAALKSAEDRLIKDKLVLLLTPAFDKTPLDPGYIKGYPPGVRENGGQYTHGSSWLAMAFARMGDGKKADEILRMMLPTSHTQDPQANALYRVEPYAIAADIYYLQNQIGRGGWTWYTGSSAWIYRIWLEEILGFTLRGQTLSLTPTIPNNWDGFGLQYRYKSSKYAITVKNPEHVSRGKQTVTLDGVLLTSSEIPLEDDGKEHKVEIVISA